MNQIKRDRLIEIVDRVIEENKPPKVLSRGLRRAAKTTPRFMKGMFTGPGGDRCLVLQAYGLLSADEIGRRKGYMRIACALDKAMWLDERGVQGVEVVD